MSTVPLLKSSWDCRLSGRQERLLIKYRSCGSLTTAKMADDRPKANNLNSNSFLSGTLTCEASSNNTIQNWCQTTPYINSDGSVGGETVFVSTGCAGNHAPLEFCFQDPVYCLAGVSTNASIYDDQIKAHENWDPNLPYESTPVSLCKAGTWPPWTLMGKNLHGERV